MKRDLLDARGGNTTIMGLGGGQPVSLDNYYMSFVRLNEGLSVDQLKEQALSNLITQMAKTIKNDQLGSDPEQTEKMLDKVIHFNPPVKADDAEEKGQSYASLKRKLAIYYLYLGTQNTFNAYTLEHTTGRSIIAMGTNNIYINLGAKSPESVVTGHAIVNFKEIHAGAKSKSNSDPITPSSILSFKETCILEKKCNQGRFDLRTLDYAADKAMLDEHLK